MSKLILGGFLQDMQQLLVGRLRATHAGAMGNLGSASATFALLDF